MNQQTWAALHLNIMETVQNEVENEEANEEDLKAIEARKMWWHAKLECGVIEVYSKEALEWYRRIINSNSSHRAWTCYEKPEPRLKVWIKPQFSHLTPTKYIELCLKFHPSIKHQPWHLESITDEEGGKRTAYIRTSQAILTYLMEESSCMDKFSIKGFCGAVVFALAKEAPEAAATTSSTTSNNAATNDINNKKRQQWQDLTRKNPIQSSNTNQ